jgi:hypothetical protein
MSKKEVEMPKAAFARISFFRLLATLTGLKEQIRRRREAVRQVA